MASVQNFRSALNGFNREDVVRYIEYINNRNKTQLEQMHNQVIAAQNREKELLSRVDEAQAHVRELEEKLASLDAGEPGNATEEELEAYRRAERAERLAEERAQKIYDKASAVIRSATADAKAATAGIADLSDKLLALLEEYRRCVTNAAGSFASASEALDTIEK